MVSIIAVGKHGKDLSDDTRWEEGRGQLALIGCPSKSRARIVTLIRSLRESARMPAFRPARRLGR
ncbi:MAG: hypothetical protein ACK44M_06460, partial [Chloroflexus sp.]